MKKYILTALLVLITSNSYACEKWKGELTKLAWESGKYLKLYNNFKNEGIEKAIFIAEAESIISEITELSDYVDSTDSCSGSKFEGRKKKAN